MPFLKINMRHWGPSIKGPKDGRAGLRGGGGARLVPVGFLHVSVNIRARLKIEQCFSDQVIFPRTNMGNAFSCLSRAQMMVFM